MAPWKEFRGEGNSFFLSSLFVVLVFIAVILIAGLPLIVPFIPPGSGGTWSRILDWPVAVDICRCLPRFRLGPVHSIDDSDHVSAALSRAACVCSSRGPGKLATRADPALRLFLLLLAVAAVMVSCHNMRDLLHRCDPVHGHSYTLPIPVTLGAFSLLFLRQFGLDYDVWADFMPPEFLVVLMPPPALSGSEAG